MWGRVESAVVSSSLSDHGAGTPAPRLWSGAQAPPLEAADPAGNAILAALCILVFAAGLSTFWSPLLNATVISGYEIVFVFVYVILSRMSPGSAEAPKPNPIVLVATSPRT